MLGLRFLVVLFALLCGGSLLAWVLTGDRRYGRLAWTIAKVIAVAQEGFEHHPDTDATVHSSGCRRFIGQ